jgi:hypothetical protein
LSVPLLCALRHTKGMRVLERTGLIELLFEGFDLRARRSGARRGSTGPLYGRQTGLNGFRGVGFRFTPASCIDYDLA